MRNNPPHNGIPDTRGTDAECWQDSHVSLPPSGDIVRANHKKNIEAALIILSMIPVIAAYPFTLKYMVKGSSVGAVKE